MEGQEEVKKEEVTPEPEVKKEERPEVNYQAELARKNAELVRLRAEVAEKSSAPKRDPADISTWSDAELKMLRNSNDASVAQFKDQADELLLERKVRAIQARDHENRRREEAQKTLETQYPDAADPSSEFSSKIDKIMKEYDLSKTPSGRLVAAKIAAAEGKNVADKGTKKEQDRVASVRGQMVDGDRPKPTESTNPSKTKDLEDGLMDSKHERKQIDAMSQILKDRGMSQDNFFKR